MRIILKIEALQLELMILRPNFNLIINQEMQTNLYYFVNLNLILNQGLFFI